MDKAKLGILLYTLLGAALAVGGMAAGYAETRGELPSQGAAGLALMAASLIAIMIGLHWLIVGIASLRD